MLRVGFIGWRGMVGSVLLDRMHAEGDFDGIDASFFSTSSPGKPGPDLRGERHPLLDAHDITALESFDVLITCQGGDYTKQTYPQLRDAGWDGYWVDAASALRMADDSVLILDPVNKAVIESGLAQGRKLFCGPNCTTSLMVMAMSGLFAEGIVEWVSTMTYQAASGGGARHMRELIEQMASLADAAADSLHNPSTSAMQLDRVITDRLRDDEFPTNHFGYPLAASVLPWIDSAVEDGQTREEWKGFVETNKILGTDQAIPVDGQCVRIGAMRCHAQALTVKLTREVPLADIESLISGAHEWANVVTNDKESTLEKLTPAAVNGTLQVPVGRLRKMRMGQDYVTCFTVGDQLLWGAAEPLRRMLGIIRDHRGE
jgi:aspartate-semialdehyde dehydrogenase